MSSQRKTYKSKLITKEYEWQHYKEWQLRTQSPAREFFGALHWFVGLLLPLLVAGYFVITENEFTLSQHLVLLTVVLWVYPFEFVCAHVYVHMLMLENYNNDVIFAPWAYYHHYVDSLVYSRYPYNYRKLYLELICYVNATWIVFAVTGLCGGYITFYVQMYAVAAKMAFVYTDMVLHEWYHTFDSKYTEKYNIFSAHFVGVHWFYQTLEYLGFANKATHRTHHDPSSSAEMEDTKEWVDLHVLQSASWVGDKYGAYSYAAYIWIHHNILKGRTSNFYLVSWAVQTAVFQYVTLWAISGLLHLTDLYSANSGETRQQTDDGFSWSYVDIRVNIIALNTIIWIASKLYFSVKQKDPMSEKQTSANTKIQTEAIAPFIETHDN